MGKAASEERFKFKFEVLRHYDARLRGNEPHITVTFLAGPDGQLVYCGTLTMSEPEWEVLRNVLARGLKDNFEVEDHDEAHAAGE